MEPTTEEIPATIEKNLEADLEKKESSVMNQLNLKNEVDLEKSLTFKKSRKSKNLDQKLRYHLYRAILHSITKKNIKVSM